MNILSLLLVQAFFLIVAAILAARFTRNFALIIFFQTLVLLFFVLAIPSVLSC